MRPAASHRRGDAGPVPGRVLVGEPGGGDLGGDRAGLDRQLTGARQDPFQGVVGDRRRGDTEPRAGPVGQRPSSSGVDSRPPNGVQLTRQRIAHERVREPDLAGAVDEQPGVERRHEQLEQLARFAAECRRQRRRVDRLADHSGDRQ